MAVTVIVSLDEQRAYAYRNGILIGESPILTVKAESEGERVLLSVIDQGPGIPADKRERVVERFVRLDESRTVPGSGLGLSLVAAVARLHGGELKFEDNALGPTGTGLKATIALPRGGPQGAG